MSINPLTNTFLLGDHTFHARTEVHGSETAKKQRLADQPNTSSHKISKIALKSIAAAPLINPNAAAYWHDNIRIDLDESMKYDFFQLYHQHPLKHLELFVRIEKEYGTKIIELSISQWKKYLEENNYTAFSNYILGCISLEIQKSSSLKDEFSTIIYFNQAYNQGSSVACYYLGYCYLVGYTVTRNLQFAVKLFKVAINWSNYAKAHYQLGLLYIRNQVIEHLIKKDPQSTLQTIDPLKQGKKHLEYAAHQNYPPAIAKINCPYFIEYGTDTLPNQLNLLIHNAEKGDSNAMFRLACWYLRDRSKDKVEDLFPITFEFIDPSQEDKQRIEYRQGIDLLRTLAETGHVKALFLLGKSEFEGSYGLLKNEVEGLEKIKLAADANFSQAQFYLGHQLMNGNQACLDFYQTLDFLSMTASICAQIDVEISRRDALFDKAMKSNDYSLIDYSLFISDINLDTTIKHTNTMKEGKRLLVKSGKKHPLRF